MLNHINQHHPKDVRGKSFFNWGEKFQYGTKGDFCHKCPIWVKKSQSGAKVIFGQKYPILV